MDPPEQPPLFSVSTVSSTIPESQESKLATKQDQQELGDTPTPDSTVSPKRPLKLSDELHGLQGKRNPVPRDKRSRKPHVPLRPENCNSRLTDDAIADELSNLIRDRFAGQDGERLAYAFIRASRFPPVTRKSLSELDMSAMISNPKLRHDINLDTDLHFRPNFDGDKGREKLQCAQEYWLAIRAELELYNLVYRDNDIPESCQGECRTRINKACQRRLPIMFETIRDILKNLVPERDQQRVEEQFDRPMLMQQIERGVCDLNGLAEWLAQLLKAHCAPMRDDWVDRMVEQIELAVETSQSEYMVEAQREVLGILEAMKLDVANHQIRHLRPLLIDDSINFEQKHHLSRIERDRIDVNASLQWFLRERQRACQMDPSSHLRDPSRFRFEVFIHALLGLLLTTDSRESFPETFSMDFDRLRGLKSELEDLVYFDICCRIFDDLVRKLDRFRQPQDSTYQRLRLTLFTIVKQSGPSSNGQWRANLDNIAVELVRQAHQECGMSDPYDTQFVQLTGDTLKAAFYSRCPDLFVIHAEMIRTWILKQLLEIADRHLNLSPIDMYNSLIVHAVPAPPPPPPSSTNRSMAVTPIWSQCDVRTPQPPQYRRNHLAGITRRIAHIAILHWRIWEPIVYNRVSGEASSSSDISGTSTSSGTKSDAQVSQIPSCGQQLQPTAGEGILDQLHMSSIQNANIEGPVSNGITESHNGDSGPLSNADKG